MGCGLPKDLLAHLSSVVATAMGLHFAPDRWADLARAVGKAAPELGFPDAHACARALVERPLGEAQIDILAHHLTIGETHFFRDERLFQVLEESLLPELIAARRTTARALRVWSAGCATGEEPYSLAILLTKLLPDLPSWRITVLGTDINRKSLKKAVAGRYTDWSFRNVPEQVRRDFFRKTNDGCTIIQEIQRMVTFAHLNLARDGFPLATNDTASMDIIFCRNVLMYFAPEVQERVVDKLGHCLVDGGLLAVSPVEASLIQLPHLAAMNLPGAVLFKKVRQQAAADDVSQLTLFAGTEKPWERVPGQLVLTPVSGAVDTPALPVSWKPAAVPLSSEAIAPVSVNGPAPEAAPREVCEVAEDCRLLFEQGRYEDVAEMLAAKYGRNHPPDAACAAEMALLTKAYANQGKLDDALEWSEKMVAADKLNPDYHYLHGTILQAQDRVDEAVRSMTRAVFLDPGFIVAHFALASLARRQGKRKESARHFKTALTTLGRYRQDELVPASEGMTAGRLTEIIHAMARKEGVYDKA